jgi:pimeloyl-ACP methyl ester carboxylesterase
METSARGVRLHFEVHGQGPPVLLIHGYPLSGRLWDEVVSRLSAEYRLIVPDLRGHGRSDAAELAGMDDLAADLLAVLEAADESRPVVPVGMSMGGYVALAFCRRYPHRVRALALVDSRASADSPEAAETRRRTADRVMQEGVEFIAEEMVGKLFSPSAPDALKRAWSERMAQTPRLGVAAALRGMADRPDSKEMLRDLGVPVLVIVGEDDVITPPDQARSMAEAAGASFEEIPRAGHMTPVEKPDDVAYALSRFLHRID